MYLPLTGSRLEIASCGLSACRSLRVSRLAAVNQLFRSHRRHADLALPDAAALVGGRPSPSMGRRPWTVCSSRPIRHAPHLRCRFIRMIESDPEHDDRCGPADPVPRSALSARASRTSSTCYDGHGEPTSLSGVASTESTS